MIYPKLRYDEPLANRCVIIRYLYLVWRSIATAAHTTVDKCNVSLEEISLHQVNKNK